MIEMITSNIEEIVYGVPQGSVLGPLLFLFDINDLDKFNTEAFLTFYANDTLILISKLNASHYTHQCNKILTKVDSWFCQNNLQLNNDKI